MESRYLKPEHHLISAYSTQHQAQVSLFDQQQLTQRQIECDALLMSEHSLSAQNQARSCDDQYRFDPRTGLWMSEDQAQHNSAPI
jgi:hypothetical protein